ncbi:P-loop containing nucleoside triphosphate hydrolase protein [Podospora appendiculata]|uniref:P-loop containing nucleoside triphosphate hydrolase protein n=1 Tax=Podospora appendiculata TaxID=314037 RepID=A0AAE1CAW6_9PEZI|nr:P-loop containing nucleoside triphosphate hydrolase protein [Podospora appendiculata]
MVQPKSKNVAGLGNSLMNDRFGKGKGNDRRKGGVVRINHETGEEYITNDKVEASWVKMRSVTQQGALEEFLSTAELAGTDFAAEKTNNVKIIHTDQQNPYILTPAEERAIVGKQREHRGKLTVPRRPAWDKTTTPEQLDDLEREAFINWRRGLAELQENQDLLMTPFERNLEVWRQLWRVIERSDLVVQIVDARNPLMFRSEDLAAYVKEVDEKKENLLLINKADMMTYKQRRAWADYLKGQNIAYKFFSAALAKELLEAQENEALAQEEGVDSEDEEEEESSLAAKKETVPPKEDEKSTEDAPDAEEDKEDADTQILSCEELEKMFLEYAPEDAGPDNKLKIGLVGYPNVGKSSTINALIGAIKVSVSATPGKTKHFQTIHLSDKIVLCDCPGLVFPNFASTKAELVCNGVLPIDQLQEISGPATLVARRIPQPFLESIYTIKIMTKPAEEGGDGIPTSDELLSSYARHRGFLTQGFGQPDRARAARYLLKDYVKGRLLYVEPPPGITDAKAFNEELYDESYLPAQKRQALTEKMHALSVKGDKDAKVGADSVPLPQGQKSKQLDKAFFKQGSSAAHLRMPFNHKYSEQGVASGKHLSGRKMKEMLALENNIDPQDAKLMGSKKHFKGSKTNHKSRGKNRGNTNTNQDEGDN